MGVMVLRLPRRARLLQRMDKNGTYNPNTANTVLVINWTAAANSTVSASHELVITGSGNYDLAASVTFTGASSNHRAYIYKNGAVLATGNLINSSGVSTVSQAAVPLVAGDRLQVYVNSSLAARSTVGTPTYLQASPV